MKVIKIERKEELELGSLHVTLTQQPPVGEMCRETQWFSESEWLWPITGWGGGGERKEQGKDGKKGGEWLATVWEEDRERRGLESELVRDLAAGSIKGKTVKWTWRVQAPLQLRGTILFSPPSSGHTVGALRLVLFIKSVFWSRSSPTPGSSLWLGGA